MLLLSLLSFVLGGLTILGLVVIGGSLVARPAAEILTPGADAGAARLLAWGSLAYAFVAVGAGGLVTAWTAPRAHLRHALLLGLVVAAFAPFAPAPSGPGAAAAGAVRSALALVAALLGGWIHVRLRGSGERAHTEL